MAFSIIVCTPEHLSDPDLAIAAARAGEIGLLNLGPGQSATAWRVALARLARQAPRGSGWGVRWDGWVHARRSVAAFDRAASVGRLPILLLAGVDPAGLAERLVWARERAERVLFEALDADAARAAAGAGYDGVVLKGNEAGGRVGSDSSFLLLQSLRGGAGAPVWVQGAWGVDTVGAARVAGADGVVLAEELWLARESPFAEADRALFARLDGTESIALDDGEIHLRLFRQRDRETITAAQEELVRGGRPWDGLRDRLSDRSADGPSPLPLGQGIALARRLAERYETTGTMLDAFRTAAERLPREAARRETLAPASPLARAHGTRYPIVQGPMTRVSDRAGFIEAVADNGALPFLALALMRGPEARRVLDETRERLGRRPWGVGILGFVPPELRREQLEVIRDVRPPFALIAGGRPSQAVALEGDGIATYLHVPSPGLLATFLDEGARRFVFEGRECGGHVGPRS
ncbi:MAG TPA: hypothetical protein VD788_12780, partial [Candidatus Polarisedimenticolaceae bacterium]|nr:hypothetical protein [Candidatus Polarisedimenticolaceae bacterium]